MHPELPPLTARTVIEAFLPTEGRVPLSLVYDTANAAGVDDQPLRLGLRRMAAAGEVVQTGRGRKGAVSLTAAGRERLRRDRVALHLAFAQDQGLAPWDRRWRLLAVSAPEAERSTRDTMRRTLVDAGAAAVSTGLYATPHDLTGMLGTADVTHLVQATATELDVRGVTDPQELTEMLWPRDPITAGYAALERALPERPLPSSAPLEAVLARQLHLADALERAMRPDPLIPLELRAGTWGPTRVRQQWLAAWSRLTRLLPDDVLYRGWLLPLDPVESWTPLSMRPGPPEPGAAAPAG